MADNPFDDKYGELLPGFPYDPESSPYDTHPLNNYLHDIFDSMGWNTWGDFAAERWVHSGDSYFPDELRPYQSAYLIDAIEHFYDRGTLSFTDFYYLDGDNFYHVLIPDTTP